MRPALSFATCLGNSEPCPLVQPWVEVCTCRVTGTALHPPSKACGPRLAGGLVGLVMFEVGKLGFHFCCKGHFYCR